MFSSEKQPLKSSTVMALDPEELGSWGFEPMQTVD